MADAKMTDKVTGDDTGASPVQETRKRKREVFAVLVLAFLFFTLTWVQFKLLGISQQLPFEHSIFFFGLVNFNIIILLYYGVVIIL